ncbi:unnamed protein product [Dibothriocephalus latus]|uniref:PH domain-containing protein n=1 Tax=Dibothriocephalus latus TaxID=60516 RepID=A0A3P7P822_DIBLA|nr:unnamed protein product [Dibothriocephalus latus]
MPVPEGHNTREPSQPYFQDYVTLLPKKSTTSCSSSRNYFPPTDTVTLSGSLYHRYKPNKWTRLGLCMLTTSARFLGFKKSPLGGSGANGTQSSVPPSVAVFLCSASSAVYAGRDSGMDHVIKITHPAPQLATVLAADSEEEAMIWIQVNQVFVDKRSPDR